MTILPKLVIRLITVLAVTATLGMAAMAAPAKPNDDSVSGLLAIQQTPAALASIKAPAIEKPAWYAAQVAAEQTKITAPVDSPAAATRTFTYSVSSKGTTQSSLSEFASQAAQTLADGRGWAQLGIRFQQVSSGGVFNLILSEASLVPSFSPACSADWSCRVGGSVIINDDRWSGATSAWNSTGGSLRDYRHYVVNHEVGHWLGQGHTDCSGAGAKAPVMLQQSINLQGCTPNPWPLNSELWTSR